MPRTRTQPRDELLLEVLDELKALREKVDQQQAGPAAPSITPATTIDPPANADAGVTTRAGKKRGAAEPRQADNEEPSTSRTSNKSAPPPTAQTTASQTTPPPPTPPPPAAPGAAASPASAASGPGATVTPPAHMLPLTSGQQGSHPPPQAGGQPHPQAANSWGGMETGAARVSSASLPEYDVVPPAVRKDILRGKDINLAILLLPLKDRQHASSSNREIRVNDDILTLKAATDRRLLNKLTIAEFVRAFQIYINVVVSEFPARQSELHAYMSKMIQLAAKFHGFVFYDIHLEFSARAADLLENHRVALDWSKVDPRIIERHTTGVEANKCKLCKSHDHSHNFCSMVATRNAQGSSFVSKIDKPCYGFNSQSGCKKPNCRFTHMCEKCSKKDHNKLSCYVKTEKVQ